MKVQEVVRMQLRAYYYFAKLELQLALLPRLEQQTEFGESRGGGLYADKSLLLFRKTRNCN